MVSFGVGEGPARLRPANARRRARHRQRLPLSVQEWASPGLPEPRALRPLARILVDLALALEHEDEADEPWTL
jgi:hypothetical protein